MLRSAESGGRQNQQKSGTSPAASSLPGRHAALPESKLVRLQAMHGNQGVQRLLRDGRLQRKLTINQPGDAFEQEADRVAEKVMRMPDPAVNQNSSMFAKKAGAALQRCSCGKSSSGSECEECKAKSMQLKRSPDSSTGNTTAPPIVHDVLNSPGRPLDAATRSFMEPRFGADFSNVRVHTGGKAAESAQAVNALAYTVGNSIVFNSGQFAPTSAAGQKVLAHELTHVAQQGHAALLLENRDPASPIKGTSVMKIADDLQRFSCDTGVAPGMSCSDAQGSGHPPGLNLEHFDQDQDTLKPAHTAAIATFITGWVARGSNETVEVHGYASCDGPANANVQLSCNRAEKVKTALASGGVTTSISTFAHGETDEFGAGLDPNRRVIIKTIAPLPPPPAPVCPQCPEDPRTPGCPPCPPIEPTPDERICGPDITSSLTTMLGTVEPWFRGLTGFQQDRSCMALGPAGFLVGVNPGMAWDTRELFLPNTSWLDSYFLSSSCGSPRDPGCPSDPTRLLCETVGSCGNSVVVDGKCMLAGTANYALFGKMCRLCHDYTGRWNRWDMRAIIGVWKTVDWDDSTPPKEVASAAYDGTFPAVPAAAENRSSCAGRCGRTHGGAFDFIWEPYKPR